MTTYNLKYHDNHLIANIDNNKVLVDTGSHITISRDFRPLRVDGEVYPTYDRYLSVNVDQLNNYVGTDFDILMGLDIMANYNMEIDQERLTLTKGALFGQPKEKLVIMAMGILPVVVKMGLNGHVVDAFWDTGAKINYMPKEVVVEHPQVGVGKDFFPTYGEFNIVIHMVPIKLGGVELTLPAAYLPGDLEILPYILGTEVFKYYTVQFRFPEKEIWLV